MTTRIRTTHVGSLPRTDTLLKANADHAAGNLSDAELAAVVGYAPPTTIPSG